MSTCRKIVRMDHGKKPTYAQLKAENEGLMQRLTELSLLCESESLFNSLVESMPQSVFSKDLEGRFTFVNQQFCRTQGKSLDEVVGKTDKELHPPALVEKYVADDKWVLRHRKVLDMVETHQPLGGDPIHVQVIKAPIRTKSGEITGVIGMFWDVTEQLRAKKGLERLNADLERLVEERTKALKQRTRDLEEVASQLTKIDQLKSAFLATVSHDLRTPMTSVMGFAKIIRKEFNASFAPLAGQDSKLAKKARRISDNLEIVEEEASRLSRMVNDFLDLSKIESGTNIWRDQEEIPAKLVSKALSAVQHLAEARPGVKVDSVVAEETPSVLVDPDRVVQVLVNLLDNAFKHTEEGYVQVRISVPRPDVVRFEVCDTGRGVPESESRRIFDKFYLVNQSDTLDVDVVKGTGLGLSICKEIVEHYGGTIWHEPNTPSGSRFCFDIPAAPSD